VTAYLCRFGREMKEIAYLTAPHRMQHATDWAKLGKSLRFLKPNKIVMFGQCLRKGSFLC